jgi:general secretion pathway protein B
VSYILDALKKSEQDQRNRHTPGLDTLHGSRETVSRPRPTIWIVSALVLVLANGLFFYWVTRDDLTAETRSSLPLESVSIATTAPEVAIPTELLRSNGHEANEPEANEHATSGPGSSRYSANESVFDEMDLAEASRRGLLITPQDYNKNTYTNQEPEIRTVRIAELPLNVQQQIPDITFSSHIYASDPSFRVVNINNRNIREGGYISDGIRLLGITEDGVVLSYLHYRIEMSVIRDWSFD